MNDPRTVTPSSNHSERIHMPGWYIPLVTLALGVVLLTIGMGLAPAAEASATLMINLVTGATLGAVVFVQQFQSEIVEAGRAMFKNLKTVGAAPAATAAAAALTDLI